MGLTPQNDPLLLDHNYDGIQELDNPLPRWWVYLFALCCIFAACYFSYYTFFGGPTLVEELDQKLAKNKPKVKTEKIDFAVAINDSGIQAEGKKIFDAKCASCHNAQGQELIGPNLTDNYWITGKGTPDDIYKVVRDGVVEKGMLAWGTQLKPEELKDVVVFVYSLRNTNPQNPKEHQGVEVDDDEE